MALHRRPVRTGPKQRLRRTNRIEQFAAGDENNSGTGKRKEPSAPARVGIEVVPSAFDGPECNGIDDKPRFKACLHLE
jgi:hypothetical protein